MCVICRRNTLTLPSYNVPKQRPPPTWNILTSSENLQLLNVTIIIMNNNNNNAQ